MSIEIATNSDSPGKKINGKAQIQPLVNLSTTKGFIDEMIDEALRANPLSSVGLSKNLAKIGVLLSGGFIDADTIKKNAAVINQSPPLPRSENFARQGMPPFMVDVVGELFPNITIGNGYVKLDNLLYIDSHGDWMRYGHLGPENRWSYGPPLIVNGGIDDFLRRHDHSKDFEFYTGKNCYGQDILFAHERLKDSPVREYRWWERIVWREIEGPLQEDGYEGVSWSIKAKKDSFYRKIRENGSIRIDFVYLETLKTALSRPEAVACAVDTLSDRLRVKPTASQTLDFGYRLKLLQLA